MNRLSRRLRTTAGAIAVTAVAGGAVIAGTALASAAPASAPAVALAARSAATPAAGPAAAPAVRPAVLVNCLDKAVVRPGQFVLTCADGNDYLTGLRWVSWRGVAFGSGTEHVNDCLPDCAAGRTFTYPVLITLWRPEVRPGHSGQHYFSRLTETHTGALHKAPGSTLPRTVTWQLWGSIG